MKPLFSSFLATLFLFVALSFTATAQTTHRCGAETTKGTPCKMRVKEAGDKCHFHGGSTKVQKAGIYQDTHRCGAQTTKGTACKNRVRSDGQRCHHHQ